MNMPALTFRQTMRAIAASLVLALSAFFPCAAPADAEEAQPTPLETMRPHLPAQYIAAFKDRDVLTVTNAEGHAEYAMIHGANAGDKLKQGDRKTPEGVYFIVEKIKYALDPVEYGTQAYATDYPNPVDKLRGKTGSGIWIHSKGYPIAGKSTRGCLAVGAEDIDTVARSLTPGTPVMIFASTEDDAASDAKTCQTVSELSRRWLSSCSEKNGELALYDKERFRKAHGAAPAPHAEFAQNDKKAHADMLDGIRVCVLKGTGYWVTFFKAPSAGGFKTVRLYWLETEKGLKIVGERILPAA
ncbi:MAG: L,D-transpeptidase family protein [Mailhella sp.]|nr:L,D-transpeptidase family protein [Mailhella sp.]